MNLKLSIQRTPSHCPKLFAIQFAAEGGMTAGQAIFLNEVAESAMMGDSQLHGFRHWLAVQSNGHALVDANSEFRHMADVAKSVVSVFALYHDLCRQDEGHCIMHGLAGSMRLQADKQKVMEVLRVNEQVVAFASFAAQCHTIVDHPHENNIIRAHAPGPMGKPLTVTEALLVGLCLDADRLDLSRVGVRPLPQYLFTQAAREYAQRGLKERAPYSMP